MAAGVAFDPLSHALAGVLLDVSLTALFLTGGGALLLTALLVLRPCGRPPLIASQEWNQRDRAPSRADPLLRRGGSIAGIGPGAPPTH
jgi:hypothetical protein